MSVCLKGIFSGLGSLTVALCIGERFSEVQYFIAAAVLGFVAYGLSTFFYIKAQGIIGAAKTSAFYSVAPFIGTSLSFLLFKEKPTVAYFIGLAVMILGTVIVVMDTLSQRHSHNHVHILTHMTEPLTLTE